MSVATAFSHPGFSLPTRPAAPIPRPKRPRLITAIKALRNNPITAFSLEAYTRPVVTLGWRDVVLVNDPEAIERVLVHNAGNYRKSRQQQRLLRPALGHGLLTAEGENWRSTRRIVAPLFTPKATMIYFEDMRVAAKAMLDRWNEAGSTGEPVDLCAEFQRLTYEIVSRSVFSGVLDEDRARIHAHMAIYFDTVGRIDLAGMFNLPNWWPSINNWRAGRSLSIFRSTVDRVVSQRSADKDREAIDLLDRLMYSSDPISGRILPDDELTDNVLTFLAAGHETTGNALGWIVYLLALFPDVLADVLQELRDSFDGEAVTADRFNRLVLTRAVVNEALRLYPPAPFIGREAIEDDELCGLRVRKRAQVLISPWIVHRHRALWSDPDAFRPERFMLAEGNAIARGAFIPFGLGPRICIGQGFAVQEILTVLATILPKFSFELVRPESVFPQARITLRPSNGISMMLRSR